MIEHIFNYIYIYIYIYIGVKVLKGKTLERNNWRVIIKSSWTEIENWKMRHADLVFVTTESSMNIPDALKICKGEFYHRNLLSKTEYVYNLKSYCNLKLRNL